ncbi:unnamed protein product, partial [Thlaspi arvense]
MVFHCIYPSAYVTVIDRTSPVCDFRRQQRVGPHAAGLGQPDENSAGHCEGSGHLHVPGKVVHGNIKASNVLLRQDHGAC